MKRPVHLPLYHEFLELFDNYEIQNWEQGRRYPTGPAATLIRILDAHPSLI